MESLPTTKLCACKECPRSGEQLPLSAFTINRTLDDCRNIYCSTCTRRIARARRRKASQQRKRAKESLSAKERVIAALENGERLQFKQLRSRARVTTDTLSDVLAEIHGSDKEVLSKNGTGPRVFFLNVKPEPKPTYDHEKFPPLSFSTISFLHPVIGGRR